MENNQVSLSKTMLNIATPKDQGLNLSKGEVLHGQVQGIREDGTVLLAIKGKVIEAATEVPVKQGQQLHLMVDDFRNGKTYLKVLTPQAMDRIENSNVSASLREMGIPAKEANIMMARKLLQHNLPVTQNNINDLSRAMSILGGSNERNAEIAVFAMSRSIPLNVQNLAALAQYISSDSEIGKLVESILQNLLKLGSSGADTINRQPGQSFELRQAVNLANAARQSLTAEYLSANKPAAEQPAATGAKTAAEMQQAGTRPTAEQPAQAAARAGTAEQPAPTGAKTAAGELQQAGTRTTAEQPAQAAARAGTAEQPALTGAKTAAGELQQAGTRPTAEQPPQAAARAGAAEQPAPTGAKTAAGELQQAGTRPTAEQPPQAAARAGAAEQPAPTGAKTAAGELQQSTARPVAEQAAQVIDRQTSGQPMPAENTTAREIPQSAGRLEMLEQSLNSSVKGMNETISRVMTVLRPLLDILQLDVSDSGKGIAEKIQNFLYSEKDLIRGLVFLEDLLKNEISTGKSPLMADLLAKIEGLEKELSGQRIFNFVSRQGGENSFNYYYFSFPVEIDSEYRLCQIRINKDAGKKSLINQQNIRFIVSLDTKKLGMVLFHVDWNRSQKIEIQGVVESRRVHNHIKANINQLLRGLEGLGYDITNLGIKVVDERDQFGRLKMGLEEVPSTIRPLGIDVTV